MRILCGYNTAVNLKPQTVAALDRFRAGHSLDLVDVSGSPTAYWHAIRDRWTGEEDLVTVEQDIVIAADNMPSFAGCDEPWCSYTYWGPDWLPEYVTHMKYSLGCTKFSAQLQRAIPADQIAGDYLIWWLIDERLHKLFRMHGYSPHVHGEVEHLHDYHQDTTPQQRHDAGVVFNHVFGNDVWHDILRPSNEHDRL